jgi:hypothetical protein
VASLVAVTGAAEEAVAQALAAAYGNADVAAEYLINGAQKKDPAGCSASNLLSPSAFLLVGLNCALESVRALASAFSCRPL